MRTSVHLSIPAIAKATFLSLIASLSMGAMQQAHAQETPTIAADRPGQATPPGILITRSVEVELGFQYMGDKDDYLIKTQTLSAPGALVRYGLLDWAELRLATEYRSVKITVPPGLGPSTAV